MTKHHRMKSMEDVAEAIGLPASRGLEAEVKADLIKAIVRQIEKRGLTHQEVAEMAGIARTTVTGILNGSLQKVTIDRLLRILGGIGLGVELKVRKAG